MLDPDGKNIQFDMRDHDKKKLEHMNEWLKGLKIDAINNYIIAWDQQTVCFYQLRD